jgi:hypothetical protein
VQTGNQGLIPVTQQFLYYRPRPVTSPITLPFCFHKDFPSTLRDPAEEKGKNDPASHSILFSMILPHEKMDFPAEYREKPSL